tara:strand:- start:241 stop:390 length:150 start_codon:yes stop_codon:yes gene_type:complete
MKPAKEPVELKYALILDLSIKLLSKNFTIKIVKTTKIMDENIIKKYFIL